MGQLDWTTATSLRERIGGNEGERNKRDKNRQKSGSAYRPKNSLFASNPFSVLDTATQSHPSGSLDVV